MRLHRHELVRRRVRSEEAKRQLRRNSIAIRIPAGHLDRILGRIWHVIPLVTLQHRLESVEYHPNPDWNLVHYLILLVPGITTLFT